MADDPKNQDEFLATARARFAAADEDEKELRAKFTHDLRFADPDGEDQWDPQLKMQREASGRPAMSFPRCHTFVAQVANEARQNKPQPKLGPRRDSDKDTADIYEGLARYIQYASDAQIAYDTAIEYSAGGSFGYYRFLTDYADDDTEDLDLKIVPVLDPLTVYGILVPAVFGRKPRFWFVVEDLPKEEYKATYPDSEIASIPWGDAEKRGNGWVGSDYVRIAEYWYVEEKKVEGKRRPGTTIKFCKINGVEVLPDTETTWPGTKCPIIPVLGKQMIREGKPRLSSVVRPQKSAQQMINYGKTRIAETLGQSPVSPFLAVEGQINGYEKEWKALNTNPQSVLLYKAVDVAGRPAGPPQRQVYEPPIQALSAFVAQEVDDMKAVSGIFDASLGANGNETSGQAILRRQNQADLTTMHFMDNLARSFRLAGEVIEELIPKIYDSAREIAILGADEKQKVVLINQKHKDESGKERHYKLAEAKQKLIVTVGKAFDSKREESFDTMQQIIQTNPQMFGIIGDIMLRNSDMAGADQAAERVHKMLPPQLQDDPNNPLPPQAQAIIAHAQQQMGLMQEELKKMAFEKQGKVVEHQGKMQQIQLQSQTDMALERMKLENQIAIAEINTKAQIVQERQSFVQDMMSQFHDQAHNIASQAADQAHERAMAQIQAQQQAAQLAQQGQQQSALTAQQAGHASGLSAQNAAQSQAAQEAQQNEGAAQ